MSLLDCLPVSRRIPLEQGDRKVKQKANELFDDRTLTLRLTKVYQYVSTLNDWKRKKPGIHRREQTLFIFQRTRSTTKEKTPSQYILPSNQLTFV